MRQGIAVRMPNRLARRRAAGEISSPRRVAPRSGGIQCHASTWSSVFCRYDTVCQPAERIVSMAGWVKTLYGLGVQTVDAGSERLLRHEGMGGGARTDLDAYRLRVGGTDQAAKAAQNSSSMLLRYMIRLPLRPSQRLARLSGLVPAGEDIRHQEPPECLELQGLRQTESLFRQRSNIVQRRRFVQQPAGEEQVPLRSLRRDADHFAHLLVRSRPVALPERTLPRLKRALNASG